MTDADRDHYVALMMDGAEDGFKQVVAQLTKNRIDGTMSEPKFATALSDALGRFKTTFPTINKIADAE